MEFASTAAVAGATAAAAYLNAKFHIRKDVSDLLEYRKIMGKTQSIIASNRCSLWYLYEEQALLHTNKPCIWYRANPSEQAVEYTWTEVYDQSCRWAQFLLDNGVKPGELVGTYLQNCPEFMFNTLGAWAIGSAAAMINYNLSGEGLIHCLKVSGSRILILDEDAECRARIEQVRDRIENELGMRIIVLDADVKALISGREAIRPDDSFRAGVKPEFPIFLFYTSGTTGMPKACSFQSQRSFGLGPNRNRTSELPPGSTWYDCMPLYHGTGGVSAVTCMLGGTRLAIGRKFSVRNFWRDIHDSKANGFIYVGETARYLLAAPPSELDKGHSLKVMYGNGMRPDVWAKFQERFQVPLVSEFFNSTEGMLGLVINSRGPFGVGAVGHHGLIQRTILSNFLVPVQIDHDTGLIWRDPKTGLARRTPYTEGGEILVKCNSEADFCGYWNNPTATSKRFEHNVFQKGDVWYRTGDALRRDDDGRWYFMDRLGDTFRWKSENVSTAEVGEVLGRFPGVVEANVYGVEIPHHEGRAGCATIYIKPEDRKAFDFTALLAYTRSQLPKYAVPVFLRQIENPTPSHNNKQNKVPLRKEGVDPVKIANGEAGKGDVVFWARPGAETYEVFQEKDWEALVSRKARL